MSSKIVVVLGIVATFSIILLVALSMGYGSNTYLFQDGSTPLTANWDAVYNVSASWFIADYGAVFGYLADSYSFPVSDGLADQILITDGDGSVSWGIPPVVGAFEFFLQDDASDIATYWNMTTSISTDPVVDISKLLVTDGYVMLNYSTPMNYPSITILPEGVSNLHFHANMTKTGTAEGWIFYEMYQRYSTGQEVLLATSENSSILTVDSTGYEIHSSIASPRAMNLTDRIVIRLKAGRSGVGDLNIFMEIEGTTSSHFEFPSPVVSASNFVPYVGSVQDVDLGSWSLTTTGALVSSSLDTGQGAYELFAMDQDVETGDAVTFLSLDTGEGANELFDMDQNVLKTSDVLFNLINTTTNIYLLDNSSVLYFGEFSDTNWYRQGIGELKTDGTIIAEDIDTGQGHYELFAMDQDVQIADTPTFAGMSLTDDLTMGASDTINFATEVGDKLHFYTNIYGIGITASEMSLWINSSPDHFSFRTGNRTGSEIMRIEGDGQLQLPITGVGSGIIIGGDVQLYRSGANILTIPDSLTVTGTFTNEKTRNIFIPATDFVKISGVQDTWTVEDWTAWGGYEEKPAIAFDPDTEESAYYGGVMFPLDLSEESNNAHFYIMWLTTDTDTDKVVTWSMDINWARFNTPNSYPIVITDANVTSASARWLAKTSSQIRTVTKNAIYGITVERIAGDVDDTSLVDAYFLGVYIEYLASS